MDDGPFSADPFDPRRQRYYDDLDKDRFLDDMRRRDEEERRPPEDNPPVEMKIIITSKDESTEEDYMQELRGECYYCYAYNALPGRYVKKRFEYPSNEYDITITIFDDPNSDKEEAYLLRNGWVKIYSCDHGTDWFARPKGYKP